MEILQSRVDSWVRDQRTKILNVSWIPPRWRLKWPWNNGREEREKIQQEYERRKKQLHDLCLAVKADSIPDMQDILCSMVLSESVYKRPASEVVRAVNRFKLDFGGQVVCLERVQPSSDHVLHRYLLAEAGDTLFASFIGTKQYKDVMADANILQGAIFHEDVEDSEGIEASESEQIDGQTRSVENIYKPLEAKPKLLKPRPKPAAHRGFLARAKGIPALELYRLAQKKNRKLVLCGHSLGGAVAVLATLAILRVIAASSKENEKVQVKCITFSQPPVGNAALRDYVHRRGWHKYFKTYCIPEDLVPRILSPAYFHHYNAQPLPTVSDADAIKPRAEKSKENEGEQLVLGVGPVQQSFWRLSRLVPLEAVRRQVDKYRGKQVDPVEALSMTNSAVPPSIDDVAATPQSLEIQEDSDGVSLKPLSDKDKGGSNVASDKLAGKSNLDNGNRRAWTRVPSLPSYVPFGQLYLLGNSSAELLSGAEYSKLTSVRSVIAELRERLQSHSMKSYRSRFQRIYDLCVSDVILPFLGVEQIKQFPHLQQWLGLSLADSVELGHIVESPVIRTATSIVPLGWSSFPSEKNGKPLKVDITGFGLHLCTLIQAQVNGSWCSTTVESFPSAPTYTSNHELKPELQRMRILVGGPLKRPPKHQIAIDSLMQVFPSIDADSVNQKMESNIGTVNEGNFIRPEELRNFFVFCTSDFATVSKEIHIRTRRVKLVGLEGAGKTSLLKAILGLGKPATAVSTENLLPEVDIQESITGGVCYSDSAGVDLQKLNMEISRFRGELWTGIRDLSRKTDLIVLVHNLSHIIPRNNHANTPQEPALSLILNEAKSLGIPWVLAITNKFSVSADQQKAAINAVMQTYQASPSTTEVINSCPYVMPDAASVSMPLAARNLIFAPMDLVRRPFQKRTILPVDGVSSLCQLVHRVLQGHEEVSLQELAQDRLLVELAREHAIAMDASRESEAKSNSLSAAAVGASLGAGLGIVLAVVMGAASSLRKP